MKIINSMRTMKNSTDMATPYKFKNKKIPEDALEQSTFWYDRNGKLHRIGGMNPMHARRAAGKLYDQYGTRAVITPLFAALSLQAEKGQITV